MSKNFNIQETVHRNVEKNQFPSFTNHRSLIGWCSMNYPKVLQNPIYIQKDTSTETQKYELDSLFQQKNPVERTRNEFVKPFTGVQDRTEEKGAHPDTKTSCFTLATTKHDNKVHIVSAFLFSSRRTIKLAKSLQASNLLAASSDPIKTETTNEKCVRSERCTTIHPTRGNSCAI